MRKNQRWSRLVLLALVVIIALAMGWYGLGSALWCGLFPFGPLLYPVFILAIAALYLWALVSILTNRKLDGGSKLAWILVLLVLPVAGLLIWALFGPRK
ncbi:MAG: PLDc N-terminal domain-containing protein [Candidatus Altiarchaeota archaeon]|nr:PLDc N-terminal domain-containing protein [Candidatus Altiarchaeota archaeon]